MAKGAPGGAAMLNSRRKPAPVSSPDTLPLAFGGLDLCDGCGTRLAPSDRASKGDPGSGQTPGKQPMQPTENTTGNGRAQDKTSRAPRPGQRLFDLREAADYLGCCERTVRELILDGVIPQVELTSRIQVDRLDLDRLIESRKKIWEHQN